MRKSSAWVPSPIPQGHFLKTSPPSIEPLNRAFRASRSTRRQPWQRPKMQGSDPSPTKESACNEERKARKAFAKSVILKELPYIIERGWGGLIQWPDRSLFARDVSYEFPFLKNESGRFEIQVLLSSIHYLTVWRTLEARIENVSVQTPSPDLLILNYNIVANAQYDHVADEPPDGPVPSSSVHVRTRIHFDEKGDIDGWFEGWSQTQREFCQEILDVSRDYAESSIEQDDEYMMQEEGRRFAEFTDNTYLDSNPLAKEALRRQVARLIDFLSYKFPQLSLLGGGNMSDEEIEELYSFFADDVEIDTPIGQLYGRLAVELVFPLSRLVARIFFKTLVMEIQSVQQPGERILSCTYATRAKSRLGGIIAFTTRSVFYIDKMGKIAKQTDHYSVDPFAIAGSHFRRSWWSF